MNKAVLLDRDGVVNVERGTYTYRQEDFKLTRGLIPALKRLQENNFKLIIITNQGGIAKSLYDHEDFLNLCNHLKTNFQDQNIVIDEVFYCPHHQDFGRCICRKPDSLMIEKAIAKYDLNIEQTYMIGDKQRDIDAAERLNIKSFLIAANSGIGNTINQILALD